MDGFLVVQKPAGMTSHDVVARVRRVLGTRKVGHAGTLDPMATGVLVIAVGWATRLLEFVVSDSKGYDAVIELGRTTDTDDVTGTTLQTFSGAQNEFPSLEEVKTILQDFIGEIEQVPPAYSAIKLQGKTAYSRARAGEVVEMPTRKVLISRADIQDYTPPFLHLQVECGSGTYIRSLARDIGERLNVGGTLSALHRFRSGHWRDADSVSLDTLSPQDVLPVEHIISWIEHISVTEEGYDRLLQGLPLPGERYEYETLPLVVFEERVVGVLRYKNSQWWPRKIRPKTL